jgi:hypothetical protein
MNRFGLSVKCFLVVLCLAMGVCGAKAQGGVEFPYPQIPSMMTEPQQRATYLLMHYWDNVDFNDMKLVANDDFMEQGFVNYLSVLPIVDALTAERSVEAMMKRAEVNGVAYKKLVNIAEKYLFEPNSPMVSDEMYIMFLNQVLKTSVLSKVEKSRFEYQHRVVMKNRVGSVATDFVYIDKDGKSGSLHTLKAEETLLIFYDPECDNCAEIIEKLRYDRRLNSKIMSGKLRVLAVYAGDNRALWEQHLAKMPTNWSVGRAVSKIQPLGLYVLRAMPAIYLLDKDKKVVKKEAVPENLFD